MNRGRGPAGADRGGHGCGCGGGHGGPEHEGAAYCRDASWEAVAGTPKPASSSTTATSTFVRSSPSLCAPSAAPPSGVAVPLDDALLDLLRVLHPEVDVAEAPDAVASARAWTACVLRVGG